MVKAQALEVCQPYYYAALTSNWLLGQEDWTASRSLVQSWAWVNISAVSYVLPTSIRVFSVFFSFLLLASRWSGFGYCAHCSLQLTGIPFRLSHCLTLGMGYRFSMTMTGTKHLLKINECINLSSLTMMKPSHAFDYSNLTISVYSLWCQGCERVAGRISWFMKLRNEELLIALADHRVFESP